MTLYLRHYSLRHGTCPLTLLKWEFCRDEQHLIILEAFPDHCCAVYFVCSKRASFRSPLCSCACVRPCDVQESAPSPPPVEESQISEPPSEPSVDPSEASPEESSEKTSDSPKDSDDGDNDDLLDFETD